MDAGPLLFQMLDDGSYTVRLAPDSTESEIVVPATYRGAPVSELGKFQNDYLQSITVPGSVKSIAGSAFGNCKLLEKVTLEEGIETIGPHAFRDCLSLASITLPSSLTSLGRYAFNGCHALSEVVIKEGLSLLDEGVFDDTPNLKILVLPASISRIPAGLGRSCLEHVDVSLDNPYLSSVDGVVLSKDGKAVLAYPGGKAGEYQIPEGVESIGHYAFYGSANPQQIRFPVSLKVIESEAFDDCSGLSGSLDLSNTSLETLEQHAFRDCKNIVGVILPASLSSFGDDVFARCSNLVSATLSEGIAAPPVGTFSDCALLREAALPASIQRIAKAFNGCKALTCVHYAGTKEQFALIEKNDAWLSESSIQKVICSDGDIDFGE